MIIKSSWKIVPSALRIDNQLDPILLFFAEPLFVLEDDETPRPPSPMHFSKCWQNRLTASSRLQSAQ